MWQYDPRDASDCLPAGEYHAELAKVVETQSKAGNSMLEITWRIFQNGRNYEVKDYITAATVWKLKGLARALGEGSLFETGKFDASEYIGRTALIATKVESHEKYGDQARITSVKPEPLPVVVGNRTPLPDDAHGEDGIPF